MPKQKVKTMFGTGIDNSSLFVDTYVGIECEMEEVANIHDVLEETRTKWKGVRDHSLRGNAAMEFISRAPVKIKNVKKHIDELMTSINKNSPDTLLSERCSTHIHINVGNASIKQLLYILTFYLLLERKLFKLGGEWRADSIFCVPLGECVSFLLDYHYIVEEINNSRTELPTNMVFNMERFCDTWPKYASLNFKTILNLGTVEFRIFSGTTSAQELFRWATLCADLVHSACFCTPKQFLEILELSSENMQEATERMLPKTYGYLDPQIPLNTEVIYDLSQRSFNELPNDIVWNTHPSLVEKLKDFKKTKIIKDEEEFDEEDEGPRNTDQFVDVPIGPEREPRVVFRGVTARTRNITGEND